MNNEHRALKLRADFFEVGADLVAVAGVVHHHEEHGLLSQGFVFGVALAPFFDAELQVVRIVLGEDSALVLVQPGAAGGVRQHRLLDDLLVYGFDQRIVRDSLHKNSAVVVPGRGGHIHLQREARILLQHPVMNILDAFEPGHLRVMNVMGLVIEHGQLVNLADDFAQIGLAVGGLADGLGAERIEKVIAQIVILQ